MANTLPARIEEYTALQAQSTFTETEHTAFKELQRYIGDHTRETVFWYWDLGLKVAAIQKNAEEKKELYGNKVLLRLAKGLGYQTERLLYNAMIVVRNFETKKAFTEYVKLRGEAGNQLTWSHLIYLAGVGDSDKRMKLAAAALEQSWTAEKLWEQVKALTNKKARGMRQPTAKVPTSVRSFLTHVSAQAEKFNFNAKEAWTGKTFDFTAVIKDTPTDKLNEKLVESIQKTREQVTSMRKHANELDTILSEAEATISARLKAQAELVKQRQQEEEEAAEEESAALEAEGTNLINLGEVRNRAQREQRANLKKKAARAGKKGPARAGRVGT